MGSAMDYVGQTEDQRKKRSHSPSPNHSINENERQTTNSTQSSEIERAQQQINKHIHRQNEPQKIHKKVKTNMQNKSNQNDKQQFRVEITEQNVKLNERKRQFKPNRHVKQDTMTGLVVISEDMATPSNTGAVIESFGALQERVMNAKAGNNLILNGSMMSDSEQLNGLATPDTWDNFDAANGIIDDIGHLNDMIHKLDQGNYAGSYDE